MSDTVRGAVFGNVGTMISFRVSAEDAQVLAQQFQPQFEANDLLQMHNRHFIINMVINGEKAPAFSATTLNLPPAPVDNAAFIIENSRIHYSKPRAVVEAAIDDLVKPPANLKPKAAATSPAKSPQKPSAVAAIKPQVPSAATQKPAPQQQPSKSAPTPTQPPKPTPTPDAPVVTTKDGEVIINLHAKNKPTSTLKEKGTEESKQTASPDEEAPKKRRRRPRRRKKKQTE